MSVAFYADFKQNILESGIFSLSTEIGGYWTDDYNARVYAYKVSPITLNAQHSHRDNNYPVLLYTKGPLVTADGPYYKGFQVLENNEINHYLRKHDEVLPYNIFAYAVKEISVQKHALSDVSNTGIELTFNSTIGTNSGWAMVGRVDLPNIYASTPSTDITVEPRVYNFTLQEGWNLMSFPFDISTVTNINYNSTNTTPTLSSQTDTFGDTYNSLQISSLLSPIVNNVIIAKTSDGKAWLPEFSFDGTNPISKHEGFQLKMTQTTSFSITAKPSFNINTNNGIETLEYLDTIKIASGWNIIRFPLFTQADVVPAFSEIVDDLLIVKNNAGVPYMPEWGFDGIRKFIPGQAYQVKMKDTKPVYELTFISDD